MAITTNNLLKQPNLLQSTNLLAKTNLLLAGASPVQATPTFSPVAGTYTGAQSITITSSGADAIYYTTDGSTPTTGSTLYSGPVTVSSSLTLKALAVKAGFTNSAIGSAAYTINIAAPTFVQSKNKFDGSTGAPTTTVVFDAPATAGNSIFVFFVLNNLKTSAAVPTDDAGNTYVLVRGPDVCVGSGGAANANTYVYKCATVVGTPQTITLTSSSNINQGPIMAVAVESTHAAVDDNISNNISFTTSDSNGGTVTTTQASDLLLLFAFYADGNGSKTFSAGTGWALIAQTADFGFIGERMAFETQTAGAAGPYDALIKASGTVPGIVTTLALKGA